MSDVVIAGIGLTPVGEQWDVSLRSLAAQAILPAMKDAGGLRPPGPVCGQCTGLHDLGTVQSGCIAGR